MRGSRVLAAALVVAAGGSFVARGQAREGEAERRFFQQQRLIDEQNRQQRQQAAPLQSLLDWQWGGWFDYYYFNYYDGVKTRQVHRPGMAVWTRLSIDNDAHQVFARLRLSYTYFHPGDEIERQEDWVGPEFDQLWYQIDFGKAFRLTQPSGPTQVRARIGRQPVRFGTGYALDLPMDAVVFDAKVGDVRAVALAFGRSVPNFPNIDRSEAVHSHSDRLFYGVQLSYERWQHHVPFIYAFWNLDRTKENISDWLQAHEYNSFYLGAGSRGDLAHNLNYWLEGVFESGGSYGDGAWQRQDYIEALGLDAGIEKLFDVPTRPRLAFEYMFASGDGGRRFSPTNATGGNHGDRQDSSFVGFGFRDTGIALSPTMSNLHVWRVGGSLAPLEKMAFFKDLEVGTNWFLYHKNQVRGAISDPLADNFDGYVGWEMDWFINWRLSSDLSWTIRYGTFFPGSAYSDRDARHMLFTGVTWSF